MGHTHRSFLLLLCRKGKQERQPKSVSMVEGREKEKVTGIKKNEGKGSEKRGKEKRRN